jgi:hypothetical protein
MTQIMLAPHRLLHKVAYRAKKVLVCRLSKIPNIRLRLSATITEALATEEIEYKAIFIKK